MRNHLLFFIGTVVVTTTLLYLNGILPPPPEQTEMIGERRRMIYQCKKCERPTALNAPGAYGPVLEQDNSKNFKRVITSIKPGYYRPIIETERLILREITMDDLEDIYEWSIKDEVAQSTTWKVHRSKEKTIRTIKKWIKQYKEGKDAPWAVVPKAVGKVIGTILYVEHHARDKRAVVGYSFDSAHWGKGYTTESTRALIEYGFTTLGLENIEAIVRTDNIGSRRVMEKSGMSYACTFRQYWHVKDEHLTMYQYRILKKDIATLLKKN